MTKAWRRVDATHGTWGAGTRGRRALLPSRRFLRKQILPAPRQQRNSPSQDGRRQRTATHPCALAVPEYLHVPP